MATKLKKLTVALPEATISHLDSVLDELKTKTKHSSITKQRLLQLCISHCLEELTLNVGMENENIQRIKI